MRLVAWVHGVIGPHNAGSEAMLHHILRDMVRRGHVADVYGDPTMFPNGEFVCEGVYYRPHSPDRPSIFAEADVILSHYKLSVPVSRWARQVGRPVVHFIHNPSNFRTYALHTGDIDLAILNSYAVADVKRSYGGAVMTVYPPTFAEDYQKPRQGNKVTLINLNNNKGGPLFWKIAKAMPDVEFLAVKGVYPVGQQTVLSLPNVEVRENVQDVSSIYRDTGILLVPSDHEAWGRVAVEAMWAGIPMVANSLQRWPGFFECVGGVPMWAPRKDDGDQDVSTWVQQIRKLLEDPALYTDRVDVGYRRAEHIEAETRKQLDGLERQLLALVNKQSAARVAAFGAEPHYIEHVSTSLHQVHPNRLTPMVVDEKHVKHALRQGHAVIPIEVDRPATNTAGVTHYVNPLQSVALVASKADQKAAESLGFPVVRCEHGIGQTYIDGDASGSYAGSNMHKRLFAYHAPGIHPHTRQRQAAPHILAQRVGCPWLDRLTPIEFPCQRGMAVGFGFHWDNAARPETSRTWDYWLPALVQLAEHRQVIATCHPRDYEAFSLAVEGSKIFLTPDLATVHEHVGVFCADNTSALYLLAALGHPVVVLNHPSYRTHVEHGLRFWDAADVGMPCNHPQELQAAVAAAEECRDEDVAYREAALNWVFYRRRGASIVEACLLEAYLDFLGAEPPADKVWVAALKSLAISGYGSIVKGRNYLMPTDIAHRLLAKKLVTPVAVATDLRPVDARYGVGGMEKRDDTDHLTRVREAFTADGISYKPGDLVMAKKIPTELREKCSKYAPKKRTPEVETK